MKKITASIVIILAIILGAIGFSACAPDDKPEEKTSGDINEVSGEWSSRY